MIIEYPCLIDGVEFALRPVTWDARIVEAVFLYDEYGLNGLAEKMPGVKSIVDIGGHVGGFAVKAAKLWPNARIASFEAFADSYKLLYLNTRSYPNVEVFHRAVVGDERTEVSFISPYTPSPDVPPNTGGCSVCENGDVVEPACSVNFAIAAVNSRIVDLLKIDCEGSEEHILPALERYGLLDRVSVVVGEWHERRRRDIVESVLSKTHDIKFIDSKETDILGLFTAVTKNIC